MAPGKTIQAIQLIAVLQPQREEMHKHALPKKLPQTLYGRVRDNAPRKLPAKIPRLHNLSGHAHETISVTNVSSAIVAETRPGPTVRMFGRN